MPEVVSTGEPLPDDVGALLRAWTDGDQRALARPTPIVHNEFHRLAHDESAKAWLYRELTAPTANGR